MDEIKSDSDILTLDVGTHIITAEAADNDEFANALSDTVTIEVIALSSLFFPLTNIKT